MDQHSAMDWQDSLASFDTEGKDAEALSFLQLCAFNNANNSDIAFTLGLRYKAMRLFGGARAVFALVSMMEGDKLQFRASLEHAECLVQMREFENAEVVIRRAMVLDGGSHWALQALAELYAATGRSDERIPLIESYYEALHSDGRAQIARYVSGIQAYNHFEVTRRRTEWRPAMPGRVGALAQAGMVMLIKDEDDIIGQNLAHHYALGFRAFCILDNKSTDSTRERIDTFRREHDDCFVLLVDDPVTAHYQARKMEIFATAFIEHAQLNDIDIKWLFFIDADEFISTGSCDDNHILVDRFESILTDPDSILLVMHWIHAASGNVLEKFNSESNPFDEFSRLTTRLLPVVPKIAFRVGSGLRPMEGNHFVTDFSGPLRSVRTSALDDWYLYHFSLRSLEHTRKKIVNGGKAFLGSKGLETHGGHWKERYNLYEKHGESIVRQVLENHINGIR